MILLVGHLTVIGSDGRQYHTVSAGRVMNHRQF